MPKKKGRRRNAPETRKSREVSSPVPPTVSDTACASAAESYPPSTESSKSRQNIPEERREKVRHSEVPERSSVRDVGDGSSTSELPLSNTATVKADQPNPSSSSTTEEAASKSSSIELKDTGIHLEQELPVTAELPRKPGPPGILGRRIRLVTNCYPLEFPRKNVYHYDVEITRLGSNYTTEASGGATNTALAKSIGNRYKCLNTRLNREVFRELQATKGFKGLFAVFDGKKNMYTMDRFEIEGKQLKRKVTLPAENPGDPKDSRGPRLDVFEVVIKPVIKKETLNNVICMEPLHALFQGKVTLVPQEAFMVLETVLRHSPCMRYIPVGRSFFYPPLANQSKPLGGGKEIWLGYHQSVRLGQKTPMVNLHPSNSQFYESIPLVEYISKFLNKSNSQLRQMSFFGVKDVKKLNKDLKHICVEVTHLPYRRKYRILHLIEESASKKTLKENNEEEKTIQQYFLEKYNLRLQFPHLPCIQVKSTKNDVYLPIEVCEIAKGQHFSKELTPNQQAEMIKFSAMPPRSTFDEVETIRKNAAYDKDMFLNKFELKVIDRPLEVDGRVLETPIIIYHESSEDSRTFPRNGTWNMKSKQFYKGTNINSWTLLSFASTDDCPMRALQDFAGSLIRFANLQGVKLKGCRHIEVSEALLQNVQPSLRKLKEQYRSDLVVVVLPVTAKKGRFAGKHGGEENICAALYSEIKKAGDIKLGLVTQCLKGENVLDRGTNPSFISNLCLKLNAKLGGVNNCMPPELVSKFFREDIIIIGVDVNHPSPSEDIAYSLAAAVGSVDQHPFRFAVSIRAQKNEKVDKKTKEVILDMKGMARELLFAYYKSTNHSKPKRIIVYRDGVSEGQFPDVQEREVESIKEACRSLHPDYKPTITFIVVQKRHHIRLLPKDQRDADRTGNVPPGTVVDSVITHPLNFDFVLNSHPGLKGTNRPCYYTVLADENKFSFDELEKMSYALCYTYARCTKSISLPAPVRYADLAAYRARRHLAAYLTTKGSLGSDKESLLLPEEVLQAITISDCMKSAMYYA